MSKKRGIPVKDQDWDLFRVEGSHEQLAQKRCRVQRVQQGGDRAKYESGASSDSEWSRSLACRLPRVSLPLLPLHPVPCALPDDCARSLVISQKVAREWQPNERRQLHVRPSIHPRVMTKQALLPYCRYSGESFSTRHHHILI